MAKIFYMDLLVYCQISERNKGAFENSLHTFFPSTLQTLSMTNKHLLSQLVAS